MDSWKSRASPFSTQGLVARRIPRNLINARMETVAEKPNFKNAFKERPCLIPVSGFYEWDKSLGQHSFAPKGDAGSDRKQPYYFHVDNKLFALAGIWESWHDAEEKLLSCTILTTEAQGKIVEIHYRMPVIIPAKYYDLWLSDIDVEERKELLKSLPQVEMQVYPVSKAVNSPKNDSPECIEPI